MHWSSLSQNLNEILNFYVDMVLTEMQKQGFTQILINTLAVNDDFLVAGGFQRELAFKTPVTYSLLMTAVSQCRSWILSFNRIWGKCLDRTANAQSRPFNAVDNLEFPSIPLFAHEKETNINESFIRQLALAEIEGTLNW
nr:uncharacterized WD repeat-containing protein C2A9.03-like [Tanacetum cinerariifolium]